MVQLLDLPNEILEIIFHGIVHDLDVCPTSNIRRDLAEKLREALNLRLIHPHILSLVDAAIFGKVYCQANASTSSDGEGHLVRLLWNEPKIAGLVKKMVVHLEHEYDDYEANLVAELNKLLGATAGSLEILRLEGTPYEAEYYYTSVFLHAMPRLRSLYLSDGCFILDLPVIVELAPNLEYLWLEGRCSLSRKDLQPSLENATLASKASQKSLRRLEIESLGSELMQVALKRLNICSASIIIHSLNQVWPGTAEDYFESLAHIATNTSLFEVRISGAPAWLSDDLAADYETLRLQKQELLRRLLAQARAEGRHMHGTLDELEEGWADYVERRGLEYFNADDLRPYLNAVTYCSDSIATGQPSICTGLQGGHQHSGIVISITV